MKIDLITPLIYGLIRREKENTERAFESCIANEREGAVKNRFKYMYDEYKRREGMIVLEQLDYSIKNLVSAPCRD